MRDGTPVLQAVERERQLLEPVRTRASAIIDTTNLSTGKLRGKLIDLVAGGVRERAMHVTVLSFGFKYGLPLDADLVFDVRFLPNPYYIPELKALTGLDEPVRNFIFQYQQTKDFLEKTEDLLAFCCQITWTKARRILSSPSAAREGSTGRPALQKSSATLSPSAAMWRTSRIAT